MVVEVYRSNPQPNEQKNAIYNRFTNCDRISLPICF